MSNAIVPYIKIIRPANVVITGIAVALGIILTSGVLPNGVTPVAAAVNPLAVLALCAAAMAAVAYGNVINDLSDVKSDRVSHPDRPLASGAMTPRAAALFAAALAASSMACALAASAFHFAATLVPLVLLTLYSNYFKRTRVVGNIIVASLVAYALLYGSLPRPATKILILPAILAFLLNFCREIVKDVQDAEGDRRAGWTTSADLPAAAIKALLIIAAIVYAALLFMPSLLFRHFGIAYTIVCLTLVAPIHIYWMVLIIRPNINNHTKRIGAVLKLEMVFGLLALAIDKAVMYFIK
jgi:4-hydroxybenzoate polyprenyltransferase